MILPLANLAPSTDALPPIVISATRLEAFAGKEAGCQTKWWLREVAGMPETESRARTIGTAFHAAREAWILGRDPFPEGCEKSYARPGSAPLYPVESDMIQRMLGAAIKAGTYQRKPGQILEHVFDMVVLQGDHDLPEVWMHGTVDILDLAEGIIDDKTCKNRGWAKGVRQGPGPGGLRDDMQLRCYAKYWLESRREKGVPDPSFVLLQHNYASKDPVESFSVKADPPVSPAEIDAHWETVVKPLAAQMRDLFVRAKPRDDVHAMELLAIVPKAETDKRRILTSRTSACGAFGGCTYREVCLLTPIK